jgi:hypothetical protein
MKKKFFEAEESERNEVLFCLYGSVGMRWENTFSICVHIYTVRGSESSKCILG